MNNFRNTLAAVSLMLTSLVAQTSSAQQVDLMRDEHYNSRLDTILSDSMSESGRTRINGIFEKSRSNSGFSFKDNGNNYHITIFDPFSNNQNPEQPCRHGKLTATIGKKMSSTDIIGCRNDQGVWFLGMSATGDSKGGQVKKIQPQQSGNIAPIDTTDELILN